MPQQLIFTNNIVRGHQKIPQPAQALLLNWCLLISSMEPPFLEGIPVEDLSSTFLNCSEPFASLCSWFLVLNLSHYFLRFQCFSWKLFLLSFMQAPSHPDNLILPGLPVLKCSDLKLLSLQPPSKGLMLFSPYKKQSCVGQKLPDFLLWAFPALRPFCLPSLQCGWLENHRNSNFKV